MSHLLDSATHEITQLGAGGRIVLPARFRKSLGIKPGDELVLWLDDGQIRVYSRRQARRRAQDLVSRLVPRGTSLTEELIAERRREAARE